MALPAAAQLLDFLNGISSLGGGQFPTTGNVKFVGSTAAGSANDAEHGGSSLTPYKTLAFAIQQMTSAQGDLIVVMPGHQESIQAAGGVTIGVSGVHILGLGEGRNRPVFTFAASTSASFLVNQANTTIENCVFDCTGIDGVLAAVKVQAADAMLRRCEVIVGDATNQAVRGVQTNANAHRLRLDACTFVSTADAGVTAFVDLAGTPDRVAIVGCILKGQAANGLIDNQTGNILTNLVIDANILDSADAVPCINLDSACTGILSRNVLQSTDVSTAIDPGACASIENQCYDRDVADRVGVAVPTSGSQLTFGRSLVDELRGASLNYNRLGFLEVIADLAAPTWNTTGTHEIAVVTGLVRLRIIPTVTGALTSSGSATIQLGVEGGTNAFVGATAFTDLTLDRLFGPQDKTLAVTSLIDRLVNQVDVGYEVSVADLTAGSIRFSIFWEPISSDGTVTAGAGGAL